MENLNKRVADCVKKKLKKEITPTDLIKMNFTDQTEFLKEYSRCYFGTLKEISRDDFEPWLDQKIKESGKKLEQNGNWLLSYFTRVGFPPEMISQFTQLGIALEVTGSQREFMWDPDIAPKFLGLTLIQWVEQLSARIRFQPYRNLQSFALNYLSLDSNWIISAIVLALEELIVRKKLDELDISIGNHEKFHKLCEKLVKSLDSHGVQPSCEILKSKGRREIRNRVLHKGYNPTEDEAFRLMSDVIKLAKDLWTEEKK